MKKNLSAILGLALLGLTMQVQASGEKRPTLDGKCHHGYIQRALKEQLEVTLKARVYAMVFPVLVTLYSELDVELTEEDVLVYVNYSGKARVRIAVEVVPEKRVFPVVVNGNAKKRGIKLSVDKDLAGAQDWDAIGDLISYTCTREYKTRQGVFMLELINNVTETGLIDIPLKLLQGNLSETLSL